MLQVLSGLYLAFWGHWEGNPTLQPARPTWSHCPSDAASDSDLSSAVGALSNTLSVASFFVCHLHTCSFIHLKPLLLRLQRHSTIPNTGFAVIPLSRSGGGRSTAEQLCHMPCLGCCPFNMDYTWNHSVPNPRVESVTFNRINQNVEAKLFVLQSSVFFALSKRFPDPLVVQTASCKWHKANLCPWP